MVVFYFVVKYTLYMHFSISIVAVTFINLEWILFVFKLLSLSVLEAVSFFHFQYQRQ